MAPYLQMLITALTPDDELYTIPAQYLPTHLELSNFVDVWTEAPLWGYLRNSLIIASFATLLVLVVALPAAYYTARHRYRGRLAFMLLVLVTQMFAPTALVVAGDAAPGEQAERFAHLVRCRVWPLACLHYARTEGIEGSRRLPPAPPEARDEIVTHLRTRSKQAAAFRGNGSRS